MELVRKNLSELKPYPNNPRVNDQAVEAVMESIRQCEYVAPIIVDENNVILAGHTRLKALQNLGEKSAEVLVREGLTEEQKQKYRLLDNKTAELSSWDYELLVKELENLDFDGFDFGFDIFEPSEDEKRQELSDEYAKSVGAVEYEPTGGPHEVSDLYEMTDRFDEAIAGIENEELREMLELRKAWFCEFNFAYIADYYAGQATPQEQEVFEMLGLVLLDRDGLIKNGFADLLGDIDGLGEDEEVLGES